MSGAVEAATFAWRLTVTGAEAVAKAFGTVGKSANENLKGAAGSTDLTTRSLGRLTKQLEGVSKQTEALEKLKRTLLGLAALGGAVHLVETSLAAASGVKKLADDTGFAVEPVQELTYALKLFHVEQETAAQAMQTFSAATAQFVTHNAGPAKQAFETLFGADAQQIAQKGLVNVDQFFMQVLDRLGKLKTQAEKIDLAKQLFGRSGAGLVGAADAGIERLSELREQARQLGIVFSEEMAEKASDAEDKMRILSETLKTKLYIAIIDSAEGITKFADLATEKVPLVTGVFELLGGVVGNVRDFIASVTINFHNLGVIAGNLWDRFMTPAGQKKPGWNFDDLQDPFMPFGDPFDSTGGLGTGGAHVTVHPKPKVSPPPTGNDDAVARAKAQKEAYDKLTFSLNEQIKAMGTSDREMFISNELRKLGANATQAQKDKIRELAGTLYDEREAWNALKGAAESAGSAISQGFEDALASAEDFNDVLKSVLKSLASIAYKYFVGDPLSQGFSSLLSGGLSGLSGSGGGDWASASESAMGSFGGWQAEGGPLQPGKWYIAGEHGKEPIWGGGPGAFAAGYGQQKQGGGPVFQVDMRGASVEAVARLESFVKELHGSIESRALSAYQQMSIRSLNFAG